MFNCWSNRVTDICIQVKILDFGNVENTLHAGWSLC
jgi:hypothetical protein